MARARRVLTLMSSPGCAWIGVTAASLLAAGVVLRQLGERPAGNAPLRAHGTASRAIPVSSTPSITTTIVHLVCTPEDGEVVQWMVQERARDRQRAGLPPVAHIVLPVGAAGDAAELLHDLPPAYAFLTIEDDRVGGCS